MKTQRLLHKILHTVRRKRIKQKHKFIKSKMKSTDYIYISILFIMILTFISTCWNMKRRDYFNRISLRPWIFVYPDAYIRTDKKGFRFAYKIKNTGTIPAFNIKSFTINSLDTIFPCDTIIKLLNQMPCQKFSLPSNDEHTIIANYMNIKILIPDSLITGSIITDSLFQKIMKREIFIHFYIEYDDEAKNPYFFRETFLLIYPNKISNDIKCEWYPHHTSAERCK